MLTAASLRGPIPTPWIATAAAPIHRALQAGSDSAVVDALGRAGARIHYGDGCPWSRGRRSCLQELEWPENGMIRATWCGHGNRAKRHRWNPDTARVRLVSHRHKSVSVLASEWTPPRRRLSPCFIQSGLKALHELASLLQEGSDAP